MHGQTNIKYLTASNAYVILKQLAPLILNVISSRAAYGSMAVSEYLARDWKERSVVLQFYPGQMQRRKTRTLLLITGGQTGGIYS